MSNFDHSERGLRNISNNTSNAYLVKALANLCSECPQWALRNLEVPQSLFEQLGQLRTYE
jgi:hypothetical protein